MSSCKLQITIFKTVKVIGSNGTTMYFTPWNQYCYTETQLQKEDTCIPCNNNQDSEYRLCFKVTVDDEVFWVPETHAVQESRCRLDHMKSMRAFYEYENEQPLDWKAEYLKLTGIDITKSETRADNGYDLWVLANKNKPTRLS